MDRYLQDVLPHKRDFTIPDQQGQLQWWKSQQVSFCRSNTPKRLLSPGCPALPLWERTHPGRLGSGRDARAPRQGIHRCRGHTPQDRSLYGHNEPCWLLQAAGVMSQVSIHGPSCSHGGSRLENMVCGGKLFPCNSTAFFELLRCLRPRRGANERSGSL